MMPLSLCDDCLDKEADRAGAIGTNVDLVRDGSPAGGTIAAFDFTERRQVPNGSSQIKVTTADGVRGRGA